MPGESTGRSDPPWLRPRERGVEIRVRLCPRSSRAGVAGLYGDRLKIRLTAPPVGGAANRALEKFLAVAARVPVSSVRIVAGAKDRSKTVLIETSDSEEVRERLVRVLEPDSEAAVD